MKLLGLSKDEAGKALEEGKVTVSIYGLGKMGLPLAAIFADRGAKVVGVDISEDVVKRVNRGENHIREEPGLGEILRRNVEAGRIIATNDGVAAAQQSDVMIIIVPTLVGEKGELRIQPVYEAAKWIARGLKKGDLVITEATMPPGTTESLLDILKESGLSSGEFGLAHAPERTMTGTAIRDITGEYPKIVGASDSKTLEAVIGIYERINRKGVIPMSSIKAAESVKVFEGIYRDVNIALANELALWCEGEGLDALEIFRAANTQPYCSLHMPGAGVGGHCIPVYPWFVINHSKADMKLVKTAREINDSMPRHMVDLIVKGLTSAGRNIKGSNILVAGLSYRGGVREFANSPAIKIIKELNRRGAKAYAYDRYCKPEDAKRFGAEWKEDYEEIDALVIANESIMIDLEKLRNEMRTKIIVDGRNVLDQERARAFGFSYFRAGLGCYSAIRLKNP
ncbi:MAG: nucleotide sugar dehydrogenase [Candidatus Methanosuratincola petrocarbonis]